ncbi:MAG: hypothetical protein J6S41_07835 [Clostridia bacterium]|nr:hypothetical protein [Clostridia bacterium]
MLTKYTAAEINARIVSLGCLLDVLHGERELLPATQEAIIKDAQEALRTYHEFLEIRERITDEDMQLANLAGAAIFGKYVRRSKK